MSLNLPPVTGLTLEQAIARSPLTVAPNTLLIDILPQMTERGENRRASDSAARPFQTSCVLVVENSQLVGIVTEHDVARLCCQQADLQEVTIARVMTQPAIVLTADAENFDSFAALSLMQQHQVRYLPVADRQGNLLGVLESETLLYGIVQAQQVSLAQLQAEKLNIEREKREIVSTAKRQQQTERERLLSAIALRIRQSLNLEEIVNSIVTEVRQLLQCDRVLVYQFAPDMSGQIIAESVAPGWPVSLHSQIEDTCFMNGMGLQYIEGRKWACADISQAGLTECHLELLQRFEVKANLAVPILLENQLWGLLIAHQCSGARQWEEPELDLLDELSVQIAIAIQQARALEQAQTELAERKQTQEALQQLNRELETRVFERTQELAAAIEKLQQQVAQSQHLQKILEESQLCLRLLNVISASRISGLSVEQILDRTLHKIYQFFPGTGVTYSTIDGQGKVQLVQIVDSLEFTSSSDSAIAMNVAPKYRKLLRRGEPMIVEDIRREPVPPGLKKWMHARQSLAFLAAPVRYENGIGGLLSLHSRSPRRWNEYEIATLIEIADYLSFIFQEAYQKRERLKAEERLHYLLNYSPTLIYSCKIEGDFATTFISENSRTMLGYEPQDFLDEPSLWADRVHPEDLRKIRAEVPDVFERNYHSLEYRFLHADGEYRWLRDDLKLVRDATGKPLEIVGSTSDITDRKLAEESLQQQVERDRLVGAISQRIRQSLDLEKILQTTVAEIQQLLMANRVLIYRIFPDGTGSAIAEAVAPGWTRILDIVFPEEVFPQEIYQQYVRGRICAIADRDSGEVLPCLVEFLKQLQVRAKIAVPIVQQDTLWGLLIAHQCDRPRTWQPWEIHLLEQLATQLAIAIQQSEIYNQLQLSEERLKLALESTEDGLWDWDTVTDDCYFSPRWLNMLGYDACEIAQHISAWETLVHPEDKERVMAEIQRHKQGETPMYEVEYRLQRKTGEWCWILERGKVVARSEEGQALRMVGTTIDITERLKVRAELRQQLAAVESSVDGIAILNDRGEYIYLNKAHVELFGYESASDLIGQTWHQLYYPDEIARFEGDIFPLVQKNGKWRGEAIAKKRDGSTFAQEISLTEIEGVGQICVCWDITPRKLAEEQLKASLQEKELLLKEVHHRVKNNLQVVSSIFALQSQYITDPNILAVLEDSQNRIGAMALIHEKLYQSHSLAKIDFADYIKNLANNLFSSYNINEKRIRAKLCVENAFLNLDTAIPCGLLINELVSNSLKHAFPGARSGEISGEITIDFSLVADGQLRLSVRDNGVGLPEGFESHSPNSLGLRLIRALTRQLRGQLEIHNKEGAVFQITFPQPKERKEL